jgi:hypothetical protein
MIGDCGVHFSGYAVPVARLLIGNFEDVVLDFYSHRPTAAVAGYRLRSVAPDCSAGRRHETEDRSLCKELLTCRTGAHACASNGQEQAIRWTVL